MVEIGFLRLDSFKTYLDVLLKFTTYKSLRRAITFSPFQYFKHVASLFFLMPGSELDMEKLPHMSFHI